MSGAVRQMRPTGGKVISICAEYLSQGHNIHDFGNYAEVDIAIAAVTSNAWNTCTSPPSAPQISFAVARMR